MSDRPIGYEAMRAAAREMGLTMKDLLVMAPSNDPFVIGRPAERTMAEWFAELWREHHATGHIRRLHYRLVSQGDARFPNGEPYVNTNECAGKLNIAARNARLLGLVDPLAVDDRRNPDVVRNAWPRIEPDPEVSWPEPFWSVPSLPDWSLDVDGLAVPDLAVTGFDYENDDQPVLVEVWVEKTGANDVLGPLCHEIGANFLPGAGYQSHVNAVRLLERCRQHDKPGHVIYVSDFDPAGDKMPPAVARVLEFYRERDPDVHVTVDHVALTRAQVVDLELPRTPIKKKDNRRARFEERHGEGAVELDALEALAPGELARIVREAAAPYRDDSLRDRLREARVLARQGVDDSWRRETAAIRDDLAALAHDVEADLAPYRLRLADLAREVEERMAPRRRQLDALAEQLDAAFDAFDPDVPERPEPADPPEVDERDVLFDSRRDWLDQHRRYLRPPNEEKDA